MGTLVAKLLLPTLSSLAFLPTISVAAKRRFHMEAMVYLFTMFFVAVSLRPGVGAGAFATRRAERPPSRSFPGFRDSEAKERAQRSGERGSEVPLLRSGPRFPHWCREVALRLTRTAR